MDAMSLLPDHSINPYYIVTPQYARTSAGVRALHLLCHWLNKRGMRASILFLNSKRGTATHPDLLTPVLTQAGVDLHFSEGRTPIVVYPEIVTGNPTGSRCVVRFLLNVPGLLGGESHFGKEELVLGYSRHLAELCGVPEQVLHVPVIDTNVFFPGEHEERTKTCFYAMKFQTVHEQSVFGVPQGAIEITANRTDSQSPQEIAAIFRRSKQFYCFENTALATEAVLCGCPAIFMPNRYLERPIALHELGWDGYAWGDTKSEIDRARATVQKGWVNYTSTIDVFFDQLNWFIDTTQRLAAATPYETKVSLGQFDTHANEIVALIGKKRSWRRRDKLKVLYHLFRAT